jgi:glycosyltransferase involved in cell wall biosynthesis
MYILLISRGIPSKKDPLWGCFEFDQARALRSIGHKVVVLSVDERVRFYRRKIGLMHKVVDGIDCYNYCLLPKKISELFGFNFSSKVSFAHYDFLLKKIIKEHGTPDIIYSHYLTTSYVATLLKKKWNIPLVAIEHWSEINKDKLNSWVKKVGQLTYNNVDRLISVSLSLQDRIVQHFGVNSLVIHNMVGADFFNQKNKFNFDGKIKFVTTGRLVYGKGFDLLPMAFAKLNLPKEKWEMNIIGGGEEYDNLQKQINELKLQDNIHLLGQKTKAEVVDILKISNAFILPSRAENFSVAVLEALACGLPVISSICGGIRECIFDFNGLLFPVDDVDALADAIKYMFDNYQSYDRQKIAEDCKNRFSPEVIAHQLTDVFELVLKEYK